MIKTKYFRLHLYYEVQITAYRHLSETDLRQICGRKIKIQFAPDGHTDIVTP